MNRKLAAGMSGLTVTALALALVACARGAAQAPAHTDAAPPVAAPPQTQASPMPGDTVVRALPDFATLVDRYGPAVVNVAVVEKTPELHFMRKLCLKLLILLW